MKTATEVQARTLKHTSVHNRFRSGGSRRGGRMGVKLKMKVSSWVEELQKDNSWDIVEVSQIYFKRDPKEKAPEQNNTKTLE